MYYNPLSPSYSTHTYWYHRNPSTLVELPALRNSYKARTGLSLPAEEPGLKFLTGDDVRDELVEPGPRSKTSTKASL